MGCKGDFIIKRNELFRYIVYDDQTIGIVGITEEGQEQENLVIPDEIKGLSVNRLSNLLQKNGVDFGYHIKKVFVSKNIMYCPNNRPWIYGFNEAKLIYCRYDATQSSIMDDFTWREAYVPKLAEEKYVAAIRERLWEYGDVSQYYKIANTTYLYNYEESPNGGIHFVDDLDAGTRINVIPPVPKREGYRFTGWYEDENCDKKFDVINYVHEEGATLTVYAGWTKE